MKVHIARPHIQAKCLERVTEALIAYAPPAIEFVRVGISADLIVMHVAGRWRRITWDTQQCLKNGQSYALIQYSQRDTQRQDTYDWLGIWKHAMVIWSYLDLNGYIKERGRHKPLHQLYSAPLGVDSTVFYPSKVKKEYIILTSGRMYLTESVKEAHLAAMRVGGCVAHLGPEMHKPWMDCYSDLTDEELAELYSRCHFVAGLRRREGFELPAAEGLLCGARPIVFDRFHYRHWYGDFAEYIPEEDDESVINNLEQIFLRFPRAVTKKERVSAEMRFHWPTLVNGFWERCLHGT